MAAITKDQQLKDVRQYYNDFAHQEWERLNNAYSKVEFNTTLSLIQKYFPKTGRIMDIGSGPGRYAIELLKKGYDVELLDLSDAELAIAKNQIESLGLSASAYHCKSATDLHDFESSAYDGLLLLGPMYHLHHQKDRLKVLNDALKLLKPGGIALLAYINSWGALKASVTEFPQSFEDINHFDRYLHGDLSFTKEESFTASFFTNPLKAKSELQKTDFELLSYAGAESFLSGMSIPLEAISRSHPAAYENYLIKAAAFAETPQYRDTTEHMIFILRKKM